MPEPAANPHDAQASDAGLDNLARALRYTFVLLVVAMFVALAAFFLNALFAVEQQDAGIVLRFGRLLKTGAGSEVRGPGLHLTFPRPIDEKISAPRTRLLTIEATSFWQPEPPPGEEAPGKVLRPGVHGYLLTGDMSALHARWVVRYRVTDPVTYCFRFHNPERDFAAVREFTERLLNRAVTRAAAGRDIEAVWGRKDEFRAAVQTLLADDVKALELGLEVDRVEAVGPVPPRSVAAAFKAITDARTERDRLVNEARAYANRTVGEAKAEASSIASRANAYKTLKVERAQADLEVFQKLLPELRKNREVLLSTLYEDTLRRVLEQVEEKFVLDARPGRELRIELNRDPQQKRPDEGEE